MFRHAHGMKNPRRKIVVAMSGGVDSSTTAALLARAGHDVVGVTLKLPFSGTPTQPGSHERRSSCCGTQGVEDACRVAIRLSIEFRVLDCSDIFERDIIEPFCGSYCSGATPNPCVECNRRIKFGRLLELAGELGADFVATGHYARIVAAGSCGPLLKRASERRRDQSYFLYALSRRQLARAIFPLGDMAKDDVRQLARQLGLSVADKPASQDICFLGHRGYAELLKRRCPEAFRPGLIVDPSGRELGMHNGVINFTVGQRKGLRIGGAPEPWYVMKLDARTNTVVVCRRGELAIRGILVRSVNWLAFDTPPPSLEAAVQIRHRHQPASAVVKPRGPDTAEVVFAKPQFAAAPGQSAVFYDGDVVVGGGVIAQPMWP